MDGLCWQRLESKQLSGADSVASIKFQPLGIFFRPISGWRCRGWSLLSVGELATVRFLEASAGLPALGLARVMACYS
jgi:hypothetical protein